MNLDDIIKKINAVPKLDHKESSDGLWEAKESDLLSFLNEHVPTGFPYPIFCSPVGGYFYLYFFLEGLKLPICIRPDNSNDFLDSLQAIYKTVVTSDARI
ncbi:MAG: hypothetical protein KDD37_05335 [Bdellovibrionales bacterium]|nr:hypothetical protein [Bdellovibrionales bacterium]